MIANDSWICLYCATNFVKLQSGGFESSSVWNKTLQSQQHSVVNVVLFVAIHTSFLLVE